MRGEVKDLIMRRSCLQRRPPNAGNPGMPSSLGVETFLARGNDTRTFTSRGLWRLISLVHSIARLLVRYSLEDVQCCAWLSCVDEKQLFLLGAINDGKGK